MNWLTRMIRGAPTATRRALTSWDFLGRHGLAGDPALPVANADSVLSFSSVATRCVALRSELMASVPLLIYRRTKDGGRERADDVPLFGVLHDAFYEGLTAYEGREFLVRSLDLAGNAYARIQRDGDGQVLALFPIAPGFVQVERLPGGRLRYQVSEPAGGTSTILQEDMLHIRGPSRDGVLGLSPLAIARSNLSLMLSQTATAAKLSSSGFTSSGFLETNQVLEEGDRARLQQIMSEYQGQGGAGRLMVLEGGMKYTQMSFSPEDSELLASRKLSDESVARLFGIPPTSVGITDKATYSNVEQESTMLVRNALSPLAKRVEAAMTLRLLTADERSALFIEHDLMGLLRGDTAARFQAYATGRQWGWLSPNDVRRAENMPPIANGDGYMQPVNMAELGSQPDRPLT